MALEFSDSNFGRVAFEREVEFGVANNPFTAQTARVTSSGLTANKGTVTSDELRSDRMVSDLVETAFSTGGDLGFELSLGGTWDDFLESLICGTYTLPTAFTGNLTMAGQVLSDAGAGGTLTTNLAVGDYIYVQGFAAEGNNGWHRVTSVDPADAVTLATDLADLTDETTATSTATVNSKTLKNPSDAANIIKRSYNLEQYFIDIDVAQQFLGQRLGMMSLSTASNAIVSGSWSFLGTKVNVKDSDGDYADTVTPPTCTDVVGATANVGTIEIDGVASDCLVQSVDLSVENNLRVQNAIGSKYPCGIGYGRQVITGTAVIYFQDASIYQKFLDHDDVSLSWSYQDDDGNAMHIHLPRVKFATDTPALEGIDTDVMESMDFQAIASGDCPDPQYQIQVTIVNVA